MIYTKLEMLKRRLPEQSNFFYTLCDGYGEEGTDRQQVEKISKIWKDCGKNLKKEYMMDCNKVWKHINKD